MAKPHPSFNVRDLDSNDAVVRQYLPEFLQETKTQLVVGHELGVDHCGHRFGPFHPAMVRKLHEVDEHVRKVGACKAAGRLQPTFSLTHSQLLSLAYSALLGRLWA